MADVAPAALGVTIGESVWALQARAPALVRPDRMVDNLPVLVTRLVELTVVADKQAMRLPPTRFAEIAQVAGTITGVKLAPMANYARLKPTHGLAQWLIGHAQASGYELVERPRMVLDALAAEAAKLRRRPIRRTCAVLERGSVRLRIVLEESGTRAQLMNPPSPESLFLLRADFTDKALWESRQQPLFARRKELTGGTNSVPLSAWVGR